MPKPETQKLATTATDSGSKALEQAQEYGGVFAPTILKLDDGTTILIPPHPGYRLLDDDVLTALDELDFEIDENCERYPDIEFPEETKTGKDGKKIIVPAHTQRGALKMPYRKVVDGKPVLMSPPYDVQQVKIVLGETEYKKLRSGTINGVRGSIVHVKTVWREQGNTIAGRQASDPKSDTSIVDSETVPEPDTP